MALYIRTGTLTSPNRSEPDQIALGIVPPICTYDVTDRVPGLRTGRTLRRTLDFESNVAGHPTRVSTVR